MPAVKTSTPVPSIENLVEALVPAVQEAVRAALHGVVVESVEAVRAEIAERYGEVDVELLNAELIEAMVALEATRRLSDAARDAAREVGRERYEAGLGDARVAAVQAAMAAGLGLGGRGSVYKGLALASAASQAAGTV